MTTATQTLLVGPAAPSVARAAGTTRAVPGRVDVDVVVIGTGAGGAVAGTEFAKAGKKVVFLEAGPAYDRRDFRKRSLAWSSTHIYAGRGAQTTGSVPPTVIASGRVVGGSTVLNSAICFRPPAARLQEWVQRSGAAFWEPAAFAPLVEEIWTRIGVAPTHGGNGRKNNLLFLQGMQKLGYDAHFMDRNAPGCQGCGNCFVGCPSGSKASVDKSILPEALNHGARILTHARAQEIVVAGGRATGVRAVVVDDNEEPVGDIDVRAAVVVVAGGALGTPLVLQNSGLGGSEVGRHLSVHPGFGVFGVFKERVVMWDGVPQGAWSSCPEEPECLLETANIGPAELFALMGRAGDLSPMQILPHLAFAGAMIRDDGGGSVAVDRSDPLQLRPKLEVNFTARDLERMRNGGKALVRGWFAAGATHVVPGVEGAPFCTSEADAFAVIDTLQAQHQLAQAYAAHPHGTARIGPKDGPYKGVVDDAGRVYGVDGVYVMDGALFPTTLGVNPQVTIMATALALSRRALTTL